MSDMPHRLAKAPAGTAFLASRAGLVAIWLGFVGLRLAAICLPVRPTSDAEFYFTRAAQLAGGLGYLANNGAPTAFWPPGLSTALSVAFRLGGASALTVGVFNLAAACLGGWLTYDLGRRLFGGELAGRIALALLAVYPNSIFYVPLALTEVFYTTLLLGGCWLLITRQSWAAQAAAGLVFGLASLVKAQSLLVVPLVFAILWLRGGDVWRRLAPLVGRGCLVVACALAVVAPWSLRNLRELHHFVLVSTNGGFTLLTGNNDEARGTYTPDAAIVKAIDRQVGRTDEVAYDAATRRAGSQWIAAHPARFAALAPLKLFRLWGPDGEAEWAYEGGYAGYARHAGLAHGLRLANQAYYLALMAGFALAGALALRGRWRAGARLVDWWLLPYAIAAYPSLIAVVFSGQSRFHYPVMPFVCMACGWLLAGWRKNLAARPGPV